MDDFVVYYMLCDLEFKSLILDSKCSDEEHTTCSGGTIAIRARDSAVSPRV